MRATALIPMLLSVMWTSAVTAEEVLYYGNGWPIALVERACDGDEGCLTQLANCAPGTDGTCGTQVAMCSAYDDTRAYTPELCVIDLRPDGTDSFWRIAYSRTLGFPELQPATDSPCGYDPESGKLVCIRLVNSPAELEAWAGLPIN